jgi:transposase-like protein
LRKLRPPRKQLEALLVEHGANITRVARALGVTRPTVYTWLYQLDLADRAGVRAMPPPAPEQRVSVTVKVRAELWRWARVEAVMFDCPVSDVVEEALEALRALRFAATERAVAIAPVSADGRRTPELDTTTRIAGGFARTTRVE